MKSYVCGFAMTQSRVFLVKKSHGPENIIGLWNGVGGAIEPEDLTPHCAMRREFGEETGVWLDDVWKQPYCTLGDGENWEVHFFSALIDEETARQLERMKVNDVNEKLSFWVLPYVKGGLSTVPNLKWLIPMAETILHKEEQASKFVVTEER